MADSNTIACNRSFCCGGCPIEMCVVRKYVANLFTDGSLLTNMHTVVHYKLCGKNVVINERQFTPDSVVYITSVECSVDGVFSFVDRVLAAKGVVCDAMKIDDQPVDHLQTVTEAAAGTLRRLRLRLRIALSPSARSYAHGGFGI